MKKLILALAIVTASLASFGQSMPTLYFKINTVVITTDGRSITTGATVSFKTHPESITANTMPCDLSWWISEAAQDSGYATISVTTSLSNGTNLNVAYLTVTVPAQQFSYTVFQGWAKSWLEEKYGSGNVVILN